MEEGLAQIESEEEGEANGSERDDVYCSEEDCEYGLAQAESKQMYNDGGDDTVTDDYSFEEYDTPTEVDEPEPWKHGLAQVEQPSCKRINRMGRAKEMYCLMNDACEWRGKAKKCRNKKVRSKKMK